MTFFWSWIFLYPLIAGICLILLGWLVFDKRYKKTNNLQEKLPFDFQPTKEVFIDPKDGLKYRVYYNSSTGERRYIQEDKNKSE
ncbi:HD family phosphohydrolase [Paenibacillus sp. KN14-4R]|uniref:HD family phosphohydrolase n=1 Tax=Paenibacillus sp. KN14-4R TaxID=3445773 RepID=UPI003F9EDA08